MTKEYCMKKIRERQHNERKDLRKIRMEQKKIPYGIKHGRTRNRTISCRRDTCTRLIHIQTTQKGSAMKAITIVHCWSAPRSRSTALLYSFEARGDCFALDEPLYRRWLEENRHQVRRPYTEELISGVPHVDTREEDYFRWVREQDDLKTRIVNAIKNLTEDEDLEHGIVFLKHMSKHSPQYKFDAEDTESLSISEELNVSIQHRHVLLIRDPVSMLSSWNASSSVHNNSATPDEVGIVHLLSIYSNVTSRVIDGGGNTSSNRVEVLDSDDLASDPESTIKTLCGDLGIPFTLDMLSWESGPHDCDGPWADWWYADVKKSTGWNTNSVTENGVPIRKYRTLDRSLMPAMRASLGPYNFLKQLTHRYKSRGPEPSQLYEDPRNEDLLVYIGAPGNGRLVPRDFAGVSPWDSSVQGGDGTVSVFDLTFKMQYHGQLITVFFNVIYSGKD